MEELRCDSKILFGKIFDDKTVEVKCRSSRCGAGAGIVVLHRFSVATGELQQTLKFKDPENRKEGSGNANISRRTSLRSA